MSAGTEKERGTAVGIEKPLFLEKRQGRASQEGCKMPILKVQPDCLFFFWSPLHMGPWLGCLLHFCPNSSENPLRERCSNFYSIQLFTGSALQTTSWAPLALGPSCAALSHRFMLIMAVGQMTETQPFLVGQSPKGRKCGEVPKKDFGRPESLFEFLPHQ